MPTHIAARRALHGPALLLAALALAAPATPAAADVVHLRFDHEPSGATDAWVLRDPAPGRQAPHRVTVPGWPTYDIEVVLDPPRTLADRVVVVARFEFFEITTDRAGAEQRALALSPAITVQVNELATVRQGIEDGPTMQLTMRYERLAGRMLVDDHQVIACYANGEVVDGARCPLGESEAVGVQPPENGPLSLPVGRGTVIRDDDADPCGGNLQMVYLDWEPRPLGRDALAIPLEDARYRQLIGEAVGVADVQLRVLLRLDLEGDGVDEVVFVADSHEGKRSYDGGQQRYQVYSYVGLRKVREGADVDTILLWEHRGTVDWSDPFPDLSTAWLAGFTDVEGDGRLELVVGASGHEWYHNTVYRVERGRAVQLATSGCAL